MTMKRVNIHDAKAHLSEYLDAAERGERIVICRRNRPVAELRLVGAIRTSRRPLGGAVGRFEVPASFFDPLPDDLLETFYTGEYGPPRPRASIVAERPASKVTSSATRTRRRR
jgi:prevent-host-death family protein